jgi:hypothetical protein
MADSSYCYWSVGCATRATFLLNLELFTPPLETGQGNTFSILVGQECAYTDPHWSESEEQKFGEWTEEIGEQLQHLPPSSKNVNW